MTTQLFSHLQKTGVVAIIRGVNLDKIERVAQALFEGGCSIMEVTLNTDGAYLAIERLVKTYQNSMHIGAGTVMNEDEAKRAHQHGAQFFVTPHVGVDVIRYGVQHDIPVFAGAMTPTEIYKAHAVGASAVKVFPSGSLGPGYFKDVRGPMPHIPLMAVGGVSLDNARAFIDAGAIGWGLGGGLIKKAWVDDDNYHAIQDATKAFVELFQSNG